MQQRNFTGKFYREGSPGRCGKIHAPAEIRETFYETAGCSLKNNSDLQQWHRCSLQITGKENVQ